MIYSIWAEKNTLNSAILGNSGWRMGWLIKATIIRLFIGLPVSFSLRGKDKFSLPLKLTKCAKTSLLIPAETYLIEVKYPQGVNIYRIRAQDVAINSKNQNGSPKIIYEGIISKHIKKQKN